MTAALTGPLFWPAVVALLAFVAWRGTADSGESLTRGETAVMVASCVVLGLVLAFGLAGGGT